MATTSKETQSKTEGNVEQVADRIREFNERIIESSKQTGEATLGAYAKMLQNIAELQENVGKASQVDWLTTFATAQANFTRDLAKAYTAAASKLVK
jgi:DNA mismatch repair ATPase MutS